MLPPTLLEFVASRSNACISNSTKVSRLHTHVVRSFSARAPLRQATMAALAHETTSQNLASYGFPIESTKSAFKRGGSLTPRMGKSNTKVGAELEKRVKALEAAGNAQSTTFDLPVYSEEDLLALYQDLLTLPPDLPKPEVAEKLAAHSQDQLKTDQQTVLALERRLLQCLEARPSTSDFVKAETDTPTHLRVLSYIDKLISRQEATSISEGVTHHTDAPSASVSGPEFEALGRLSIQCDDYQSAKLILTLMKNFGLPISEDSVNSVMKHLASDGNVAAVEGILKNYLSDVPTDRQRHYHITAHLKSTLPETIPTSALDLLHVYEDQNLAVPMQAYTSVITTLFATNTSLGRAHAWDLYSHMRYVAHPNPDATLYALMIRACASPFNLRSSEPERALDLWTEMTVDHKIPPTSGAYDAVILACARSGKKMYVGEAFRLARQMLDSHRDARGMSAFAPSRRTFCALLEGAKRVGDLGKARWILAEMASERRLADGSIDPDGINEEIMMHMFHSYASYKPPVRRAALRQSRINASTPETTSTSISKADVDSVGAAEQLVNVAAKKDTFTSVPPQSSEEVLQEVQILFDRIVRDNGLSSPAEPNETDGLPAKQLFKEVKLTPRLLNSYLSVFYKHAPLPQSRALYHNIFQHCNVQPTGRTFTEALERCANSRRGDERPMALAFAEEVWAQWRSVEESGQDTDGRQLRARTIEKAHIAMIRILALTESLERAMQHVRAFASQYPAAAIRTPTPKPYIRSSRTSLVASRPLVRLTSNIEVPDDNVPPLLMFDDLQLLHHRLLAEGMSAEIGYITYLCKSYEWALRIRRDAAMKETPTRTEEIMTVDD